MCLTALAWQLDPRFPLVLAANRDEFHHRPAAPMQWWADGQTLAGRDLQAGGTWLGLSRLGRLALLTNVREPGRHQDGLPSRGELVPWWLERDQTAPAMAQRLDAVPTNGYNLLGIDWQARALHCWSNRHAHRHDLKPGLYGLSNAALETPWPKVERLKGLLKAKSEFPGVSAETLLTSLADALQDRHQPSDEMLPRTGVPWDWERHLGRVFIQTPDGRYGTRCSTVVVVEALTPQRWRAHVQEQSWDTRGQAMGTERYQFEGPN